MSKAEALAESTVEQTAVDSTVEKNASVKGALFELTQTSEAATVASLREAVDLFVRRYLDEMDGEMSSDFYDLVLSEVEAPLLKAVMEYTRQNQSRASTMLGLNRGTLRKKLKQYAIDNRGPAL
ncbi:DNA-binding transcriptional regulator Fis [Congregibacter brevis]|uniref:Putative Fis-like DNA-binding protein n=1 Tax=Congregibacter brevis TaxID=3081201 RepID=A0ABZ0IBL6_9GAMM|nr:DNA-binding transcriptional regulator Fis [Congregibacter sp. IMCC45268]